MTECAMIAGELASVTPLEALLIGSAVVYFVCRYDVKSLFGLGSKSQVK